MIEIRNYRWLMIIFSLIVLPVFQILADGGYFSSRSIAVSTDQQAIIIQNGNEISMTFSTGYTGDGENFGWIIPTPVPPVPEDISEAGENGETAFKLLDAFSAPGIYMPSGCFPSGTEVLTPNGARPINDITPGMDVYAYDLSSEEWTPARVIKQGEYIYEGDMITIHIIDSIHIKATGNHPFYVLRGDRLALRPLPKEIPEEEQGIAEPGRWVDARFLKEGDLLKSKNVGELIVTDLSSQNVKTEVYHLEIYPYHNYAIHSTGILVHNGEKEDSGEKLSDSPEPPVSVYGRINLEHYEVSILGATDALDLIKWLQINDYQVNPAAREVLDSYIEKNWAFVAVKLNLREKRHYESEFLPPLTIKYHHNRLLFPLRISSVSTDKTINITLYVISESTMTSSNFSTTTLRYNAELDNYVNFDKYIESTIWSTMADHGSDLVIIWSGEIFNSSWRGDVGGNEIIDLIGKLMKIPSPESTGRFHLTRIEARMEPSNMIDDIEFVMDPESQSFYVWIRSDPGLGWGPELITAAWNGEISEVQKLLEAGADVNMEDDWNQTSLMMVAKGGHVEIVKILLQAGADVNAKPDNGSTAIMKAIWAGYTEVVQILIEAGADVNDLPEVGLTALMLAADQGYTEIVKILIEAGAEVNMRSEEFMTTLGIRSKGGWTSLMRAAFNGHTEVVKILLQAGAIVSARTDDGRTALMMAEDRGHTIIIDLLRKAGVEE